jgi:hypothetical protein
VFPSGGDKLTDRYLAMQSYVRHTINWLLYA